MSESELKLLPCPFCGKQVNESFAYNDSVEVISHGCLDSVICYAERNREKRRDLIKDWNTRAKDPEKEALIAALETCLIKGNRWHPCDPVVINAKAALKSARDE